MKNFNKTIWMCWFQGWDNAPDICQLCVESWKYHNPGWDIKLLDETTLKEYVDVEKILPGSTKKAAPAAYSDVIRVAILKEYGGVWSDSTTFCNRPLDDWLFDAMTDSWCYYRQECAIASWFIAAEKDSYIMQYWYDEVVSYWKERLQGRDRMNGEYKWFHFLFAECLEKDEKFRSIFDSWERIDCTSFEPWIKGTRPPGSRGLTAHLFTPYVKYLNETLTPSIRSVLDNKEDAMYKLTYKCPINWRKQDTSLRHLIKSIDIDLTVE